MPRVKTKKQVSMSMDHEIMDQVATMAEKEGRSLSNMAEKLIKLGLQSVKTVVLLIFLASCNAQMPMLDPSKGCVIRNEGGRTTVLFPEVDGDGYGYAEFFFLDGVPVGNRIKIVVD